jgi:hypothetical protein
MPLLIVPRETNQKVKISGIPEFCRIALQLVHAIVIVIGACAVNAKRAIW